MFGNAAANDATCHSEDRRCGAGTKRRPQTHIAPSPMPIVTRLNTTTSTVSLSNVIDMLAPVVEIMRHGILCVNGSTVSAPRHQRSARWREVWQLALAEHMTAAESLEMRVIASLESMTRPRGRFAAVAPTAATMTSLATTPKARISISPSMRPMFGSAFACTSTLGAAQKNKCNECTY